MIKNLILDYNGVISDDFVIVYKIVNMILIKFGASPISFETLREIFEIPQSNIYKKLLPGIDFDEINKYYFEVYDKDEKPRIYPTVKEALDILKNNKLNMIILSSHDKPKIISELQSFHINPDIFSDIIGNTKDKRLVIGEIIQRNHFNPIETVYIGDTEHDIKVAKQAGVISIASVYGYKPQSSLEKLKPDYYLSQFDQILKIIGVVS